MVTSIELVRAVSGAAAACSSSSSCSFARLLMCRGKMRHSDPHLFSKVSHSVPPLFSWLWFNEVGFASAASLLISPAAAAAYVRPLPANVKGDGRIFGTVWEGRRRCCIRTEYCLAFYVSALLQALAAMTQNSDRPALSFSDSCKVLGVNEHVTEEDLKTAFHKKALLYHPDRFFN